MQLLSTQQPPAMPDFSRVSVKQCVPDDLWLVIFSLVAHDYKDLVAVSQVCRRFARLAAVNRCWFEAYRNVYPALRSTYCGNDSDWKRKLSASRTCIKNWEQMGRRRTGPLITEVIPRHEIASRVCSSHFEYASVIGDHLLEFPTAGKCASGVVGLSVIHPVSSRTPDQTMGSSVLFAELSGSVIGHVTFSSKLVLKLLDSKQDFFVLADEDETRWTRLEFRRLSACCVDGSTESSSFLSEFVMPGDVEVFASYSWVSHTIIVLGISDNDEGVCLLIDAKGNLVSSRNYGRNVSAIDFGDPYDSVVLTGHEHGGMRIWDFETGAPLLSLEGSSPEPILGFTWREEPESWLGEWRRPKNLSLVTFTDWSNGSCICGGEFVLWDVGDLLAQARARLGRRTVSLPPITSEKMSFRHRIELHPGDDVASYCVLHPLILVITCQGFFEALEIDTGRSLCRVKLEVDVHNPCLSSVIRGPRGEILVATSNGLFRLNV